MALREELFARRIDTLNTRKKQNIVTIMCDSASRYLSGYNDTWMRRGLSEPDMGQETVGGLARQKSKLIFVEPDTTFGP